MPGNLGNPLGPEAITMHRKLERQVDGVNKCEPWDRVVADAAPCDHIVQQLSFETRLHRNST